MISLEFSMYGNMPSADSDSFTSSFPTWIPFVSFSCLTVVVRLSIQIEWKWWEWTLIWKDTSTPCSQQHYLQLQRYGSNQNVQHMNASRVCAVCIHTHTHTRTYMWRPDSSDGKESVYNAGRPGFNSWVGKTSWRRAWQPTPVFLPGESHGQWSLVGSRPWGCKESGTTERLTWQIQTNTQ